MFHLKLELIISMQADSLKVQGSNPTGSQFVNSWRKRSRVQFPLRIILRQLQKPSMSLVKPSISLDKAQYVTGKASFACRALDWGSFLHWITT